MEAGRETLLTQNLIEEVIGQVALAVPITSYDFRLDQADQYLYLPEGSERRLVVFHATENGPGDMQLESADERHARGWRKCAVGAGLYGGNTPFAASASMVDSDNPRQIHMYATEPVARDEIATPKSAGYLGKMIRSQFDRRFAEKQARQKTAEAAPIELLEPGLVSAALRDVHVAMPNATVLKPRWIKVSAPADGPGNQSMRYLGTLREQPNINKTTGNRIRFWATVGAQIGNRALSGTTSRG